MILTSVDFNGKHIELAKKTNLNSNIITVLMGNNGVGKSRLIQLVCSTFIFLERYRGKFVKDNFITNLSFLNYEESISYSINDSEYKCSNQIEPYLQTFIIDGHLIKIEAVYPFTQAKILSDISQLSGEVAQKIEGIIHNANREVFAYRKDISLHFTENENICNKIITPTKVLAVTGSPYDKFPFHERSFLSRERKGYIYLGSKCFDRSFGRRRFNFDQFLQKKFDQLGASFIKLLLKPDQEKLDFTKVLNAIGVSKNFSLNIQLHERLVRMPISKDDIYEVALDEEFARSRVDQFNLSDVDKDDLSTRLFNAVKYVIGNKKYEFHETIQIQYDINLDENVSDAEMLASLELLSDYGLLALDDITFTRLDKKGEKFPLSGASSGQLSLLFIFSSIAGELENDSLIFIDEPELSLHPEWQLNFMPLLEDVFSSFKNCHFIIATHSPNIVSSLPKENCYLVNLEDKVPTLKPSKDFHNRSADFQLAEAFNRPGNRNEYLTTQVIEVLDEICENNNSEVEIINKAKRLLTFEENLTEGDQVKTLLSILKKTLKALNLQ
ncbi:AAA family ATPase [Pseudoalteromonas sp. HF66]|uniref:AAA family ATPase n=1 Tax=Pseudoalteromonas sp. HF66 TaxID=2721559 RepID=UPI00143012BD|nr:AAA family ATPase [Pseudoalteromonas sp. HF66]NIZ06473.1 AAA family ATPase [Pseudoalteromonas sp. HF66]